MCTVHPTPNEALEDEMSTTEHRITYRNVASGGRGFCRMFGAPDQDMAVMFVQDCGCEVLSIESIDPAETPRLWGEMDWEYGVPNYTGSRTPLFGAA